MRTASLVFGIVGGVTGILAGLFAIVAGGLRAAFEANDSGLILGLGVGACWSVSWGRALRADAWSRRQRKGIMRGFYAPGMAHGPAQKTESGAGGSLGGRRRRKQAQANGAPSRACGGRPDGCVRR